MLFQMEVIIAMLYSTDAVSPVEFKYGHKKMITWHVTWQIGKNDFFPDFFEKMHDSRPGAKNVTQNTSTYCASNAPTFDSLPPP